MAKGKGGNNDRESSIPEIEIEAGVNLNRSSETIDQEIDRENTEIQATHENCDTTIEVREGGVRGFFAGRSEVTTIDCEPDSEPEPEPIPEPESKSEPEPESTPEPEPEPESKPEFENGSFINLPEEDESGSFFESEPESESESEFESEATFC